MVSFRCNLNHRGLLLAPKFAPVNFFTIIVLPTEKSVGNIDGKKKFQLGKFSGRRQVPVIKWRKIYIHYHNIIMPYNYLSFLNTWSHFRFCHVTLCVRPIYMLFMFTFMSYWGLSWWLLWLVEMNTSKVLQSAS